MELTIILVTVALLAGYALSSIIGFRNAKLQGMEDKLRRGLLADAEIAREKLRKEFREEREELKGQVRELQIEVKSLQNALVNVQQDTLSRVAALQGELQAAGKQAVDNNANLHRAMQMNTDLGKEIHELKTALGEQVEENKKLAGLLDKMREENAEMAKLLAELQEQVAKLLDELGQQTTAIEEQTAVMNEEADK